jgi:DNA-binding response OmpR family regulator
MLPVERDGIVPPVRSSFVGKLTVLVIDDDPVILELLRVNFEIEGFDVVCARDGDEGFAMAQELQPDVVISDIMMPRRDGLQLLSDLKADPRTEDLPVILLSAKAQKSEVEHGLQLGADDYITKPFDPIQLIDRLNAVVGKPKPRP